MLALAVSERQREICGLHGSAHRSCDARSIAITAADEEPEAAVGACVLPTRCWEQFERATVLRDQRLRTDPRVGERIP